MSNRRILILLSVICIQFFLYQFPLQAGEGKYDFTNSVIVTSADLSSVEEKAILVLIEEVEKRTGIKLVKTEIWPEDSKSVIAVGLLTQIDRFAMPYVEEIKNVKIEGSEGFYLRVFGQTDKSVIIAGQDERGILYGIGYLLRKMSLTNNSIMIPSDLQVNTSPKYPLRGHQLGYRPKTNAYDAWTAEQFDQYIRELALFGTNSIEIIPPVSDDDLTSPLMPVPPMDMMIQLSDMINSYGLDVWIWYPNVGDDYLTEAGMEYELTQREEVFKKLKHINALLVPGGDPGHLDPDIFFPWMDKVAAKLIKYHPDAKIWVSPQAMQPTPEWLEQFYRYVNKKPEWLGGVVFAPWIKTLIQEMRAVVDADIPIRRYPDITHNVACQYPVKEWDIAFALSLHRECYNPRPLAMKSIHNAFDQFAAGSITYSEGINDDVNKFIWGDQDWDPETPLIETLRDYCRLFISPDYADELAQGFMAEEKNWVGPLLANSQVAITLTQWRDIEKSASGEVLNNYRFQMGLSRAYYDAYIQQRLINETNLEMRALEVLETTSETGALKAIQTAEAILSKSKTEPVALEYRDKCNFLADKLFANIRSQTYVKKHGAQKRTRGAFMEGIDEPLNNVAWLTKQFALVKDLESEDEKLKAIDEIINRTNPGPGGFYDNMGSFASMSRIENYVKWEDDPGSLKSPRIAYYYNVDVEDELDIPMAWKNQVGTLYDTPLKLFYNNLDPNAQYLMRVGYTGKRGKMIRLMADDKYLIHDLVETYNPPIQEYEIPKEATADGELELTWRAGTGERGAQVSEIWLIKK